MATEEAHHEDETASYSYLPPSMLSKRVNWDIFLSFRGEDTRHKITTKLRRALESEGVRVFMDDEGMRRGDFIEPSLLEAIVDSALAIAIVSPRYSDSHWCLEELSIIFHYRKRVLPVFYGVDPSHVRWQKGNFGEEFRKLAENPKFREQAKNWKDALYKTGNISGYPCNRDSDEPELIQRIVKQVVGELKNNPEYVAKVAVGLDVRVSRLLESLDILSDGVRYLGIHGTPGIGKTTLAKAAFNELVVHFKNRCFISSIRQRMTKEDGVLATQNLLINGLSPGTVSPVKDEKIAQGVIKELINDNKVLIVLDDVFEADQLEKLGIKREFFKEGSRIIVTGRDRRVLLHEAQGDHELFEAQMLDDSESLELFSIHALGRSEPTQEFLDLSREIVSLTGGLPLALEVFGSYLVKRTKEEWDDSVKKMRQLRPHKLQGVLRISYDGLDEEEKTIFLDISCLLLQPQMTKEEIVDGLEGCGLRAEIAIGNLVTKSLMKIIERDEIWMHDQIRDMGRQIVREESDSHPERLSRLWEFDEIMRALQYQKAEDRVRGIGLDIKKPSDISDEMKSWINFLKKPNITSGIRHLKEKVKLKFVGHKEDENSIVCVNSFKKMENLKLLRINYVKLEGDMKDMPTGLRWLQWKGCPEVTLPASFPEEICVLDLRDSNTLRGLWHSSWLSLGFQRKVARNLVVLNLSKCPSLTSLPDLSAQWQLKKLILEYCVGLTEIHESVGNLSSLVHCNLHYCLNLKKFPRDVTGMKGLRELILSDCSEFNELPNDVRSMKSLTRLLLDRTAITQLPEYLFHLTHLEVLSLTDCTKIQTLPEWIWKLSSLKELYLSSTSLQNLPYSIGLLSNLEKLHLMHCKTLSVLPDSVGNLKSLTEMYLNSSSIVKLPPSVCSLAYLKVLTLGTCQSLIMLPSSIDGLISIVELELSRTSLTKLPDEICSLKFMKKLELNNCASLQRLPESIGEMSNLTILSIRRSAITQLPESIGELESLTSLSLDQSKELRNLPNSIGKLRSLRRLAIGETSIASLPESFGMLESLMELRMPKPLPPTSPLLGNQNGNTIHDDQPTLEVLPASFCNLSSLKEFNARACKISGQIQDDFCKLSKLEILNLSYNDFHSLPSSLEKLCVLKKLLLSHCEKLRDLPLLPATLEELIAADCHALESVSNISNLAKLQELNLANCHKIRDVPGLECLKSLRRLYMGGCNASKSSIRRLSKLTLRNLNNLSIPGSHIPNWFTHSAVNFATRKNLAIKSVLVGVIVSVDSRKMDVTRSQLPSIVDIQARIIREDERVFSTVLILNGVPTTSEDQLYLCRFKYYHPLVLLLSDGDTIQVGYTYEEDHQGVELKKWGIYLVFENDDDYDGDEELVENQSITQKLVRFFRSQDEC